MGSLRPAASAPRHRPGWSSNTQLVHGLCIPAGQSKAAARLAARAIAGGGGGENALNTSMFTGQHAPVRQRRRKQVRSERRCISLRCQPAGVPHG